MIDVPSSDSEYRDMVIAPIVKAVCDDIESRSENGGPIDPMVLTRVEDAAADRHFCDAAMQLAAIYQNGLMGESFAEAVEAIMEQVHEGVLDELRDRGVDTTDLP